jgi:predicted AlkP superfamily phosphohydrolase/phosphomutase
MPRALGTQRPRGHEETDAPRDPAKRETLKRLAALGLLAAIDVTALASCGRRGLRSGVRERKVIVLGLDGIDPGLVARLIAEGGLPNMQRLSGRGGLRSLTSTVPPQSPVAWASFATGRDPGGHGIYDFILRDPETYIPYLSIARTEAPHRTLSVGQWRVPLSKGKVELLRRGRAFWEVLEERGVPCAVYRLPTNFPPPDTGAKQLAGLGAPDLRGTYGEFSYFTDEPPTGEREITGGAVYPVRVSNGRVQARLIGPANTLRENEPDSYVDFEVWLDRGSQVAKIVVQEQAVLLRQGEWSEWVPLRFDMIPHVKSVSGICRFYLKEVAPHFKLYVTPVNVDPVDPALPIAAPRGFARTLAERHGRFYTQGFPQDVKALRHGVLDDGEYLQQSGIALGEARRMYESELNEFGRGLLCYYFSTTDRTQHMFWRTADPRHPAYDARLAREYGSVIEECYRTADELVGQALEATDGDTTLIVLSDHGFAPFYRTFNLNTWLSENGYLAGIQPWDFSSDIFSNADWGNTAAYGIGFNGLYLNLEGREGQGAITAGQREMLARRLSEELRSVRDPDTGERVIGQVYLTEDTYLSAIPERQPDLVIGYARGYRCSDASVLGEVTEELVADNKDKWSGDHCIDRSAVPGILLTNRGIRAEVPGLPDVAATVLSEFGVEGPGDISGEPIW